MTEKQAARELPNLFCHHVPELQLKDDRRHCGGLHKAVPRPLPVHLVREPGTVAEGKSFIVLILDWKEEIHVNNNLVTFYGVN